MKMDEIFVLNFIKKFRMIYKETSVKFYTLQEALESSKEDSKPVLIYLHNKDNFSLKVLPILNENYVREKFHLVSWDVTDYVHTEILIDLISCYSEFDVIESFIRENIAAVFIFKLETNEPVLSNMFTGVMNEDISLNDIKATIDDFPKVNTEELILMDKFVQKNFNFADNLSDATIFAINNEMPLLVYIENGEDTFSKKFINILNNKDANELFTKFCYYKINLLNGYNMSELSSNENINDKLTLYRFLKQKRSGLFIYSPVNDNMELFKNIDVVEDEGIFLYELYNMYMEIEDNIKKQKEAIEKLAVVSFVNYFESTYGMEHLSFQIDSLEAILRKCIYVDSPAMENIIVVYLHNNYEKFSMKLMHMLADGPVRNKLENFCFLPWDLNKSYKKVLKNTVRDHFDLEFIEEMIENGKPGLLFFVADNGKPALFTHVTSEYNLDFLLDTIDNVEEYFSVTHNSTDYVELKCSNIIENLILKPFLRNIPLRKIIPKFCLAENLKERKILLLFFYVPNSRFTTEFLQWLNNSQNSYIIKKYFYLVSWDISNTKYHPDLQLAINRYFSLKEIEVILAKKESSLFVFHSLNQTLSLIQFFNINKSLKLQDIINSFSEEIVIKSKLPQNVDSAGPVQFQQLMFDRLGNRDYDCIELNKSGHEMILQKKIGFAFYGPPNDETTLYTDTQNSKIKETSNLIKSVCSDFSLNNEIMISCVYTCTTPTLQEKLVKYENDNQYNPHSDFNIYPVFVLRKCIDSPQSGCRIIVDHDLKVYESWSDYLENNDLPKCECITPKNGRYTGDVWGNVEVEWKPSPACGFDKAILKGIDIGSAVVGIGAGGLLAASTVPTLAVLAPVAPIAAVAGVAVGGYSLVRSGISLYNRKKYKQSLDIRNNEARGAYINILAGSLGFVGAGSQYALSYFARNGAQIGSIARYTVNGLTGVNVLVSGASIVNSSYDVINQWMNNESPSPLVILQLSSSILFFGHSVYNIRSADTIVNQAQYEGMQEVMSSLRSNRHRRTVQGLTKASIQEHGVHKGTAEVISYVKNLDNRDDVIATLTRSNKLFKQNNIKYTVHNGELNFNGIVIDINDFATLNKKAQQSRLMNLPEKTPNFKNTTPKLIESYVNCDVNVSTIMKNVMTICQCSDLKSAIESTINMFSDYVQEQLLRILSLCLKELTLDIDINISLERLFPGGQKVAAILKLIIQFFKSSPYYDSNHYNMNSENNSNCSKKDNSRKIVNRGIYLLEKAVILSSLKLPRVILNIINFIKSEIILLVHEYLERENEDNIRNSSRQTSANSRVKKACKACGGHYYC